MYVTSSYNNQILMVAHTAQPKLYENLHRKIIGKILFPVKYLFYEKFKGRRDQMKEGSKEETLENILKF